MNKELNIQNIINIVVYVCFLIITLILVYFKDTIKNLHVVFVLVLLLLLILKNTLLKN